MRNLKDFFYFQHSDRLVLCAILLVAVVSLTAFWLLGDDMETTTAPKAEEKAVTEKRTAQAMAPIGDVKPLKRHLAPFDPNTADSTQLLQLGLQRWQVRAIYRYRAAGGVYREPSDFARLYGLTKKQYRELAPYIRISDDYKPASELYEGRKESRWNGDFQSERSAASPAYERQPKLREGETIALNTADTSVLKTVPSIGSYFARQIVSYRKRLGGYANVSQLMEIRNFPESSLPFFTISSGETHPINVNKATLNQLTAHPYINFYQARSILEYRRLRGPLKSLQDLRLLKGFDNQTLQRLQPYVTF